MPIENPVPVSGSIQSPTANLGSTPTSPLTVVVVVVVVPPPAPDTENSVTQLSTTRPPVPRQRQSLDAATDNIGNGRNVEKEKSEKIDFLCRENYHVEQELKGAERKILNLREKLHALDEIDWNIKRMKDLLERVEWVEEEGEDFQEEENDEEAASAEISGKGKEKR
ncbi:hypothetical protein EAE96_005962 [Botrytis aclada]|nr:hypothetical protein EAE96_005962 [Botrytis aclada]